MQRLFCAHSSVGQFELWMILVVCTNDMYIGMLRSKLFYMVILCRLNVCGITIDFSVMV